MFRLAGPLGAATLFVASALNAASMPAESRGFLDRNCVACHAGEQAQAGIRLDGSGIDWTSGEATALWERVYDVLETKLMPPRGAGQPSEVERERMAGWLEGQLLSHTASGASVPRRLNRYEYENSIRSLFNLPDFEVPHSFPADDSRHGFDNNGEGLVLSPPLMAQYLVLATHVADEVLPPARGATAAASKLHRLGRDGLATGAGGLVGDGAFRIVSSRNMANVAAWPVRFEARQSGIYRLTFNAVGYETDRMFYEQRAQPFRLQIYARPKADEVYAPFGDLRILAEFDVHPGGSAPRTLTAEIELLAGETFGIRWENGPAYSDPPRRDFSHAFLADRLTRDRLFYAAMLEFGGGARSTTEKELYEAIRALMDSGNLDLHDPRLDKLPEVWGGGLSSAPHNWIKGFVHQELFRFGPAVDLSGIEVEGPLRLVEDDATRARRARSERFLGERAPGTTDEEHARTVIGRFLPRAFRRPVEEGQVEAYAALAAGYLRDIPGARIEDALHLVLRRALVSPNFLYRGLRPGPLDSFDLASRLSYFITSAPPDDALATAASGGALSDPAVLAKEAERLLLSQASDRFVRSFTGQWLSTRLLRGIMPDPRLIQFGDANRDAMIAEAEMLFAEILREDLSLEAFIDPGFSYRNARLNKIYGDDLEGPEMRRVTFETGGRYGGILSLAAVMMATANGVDTNPVHRGVWLLENVFGTPAPEPPPDVPAIAPDTSGATLIRDQLAAHRADPTCARCHDRIDPLGMVLESFDPVGLWRDHYPVYTQPEDGSEALNEEFYSTVGKGTAAGPLVDSVGLLADGTRLDDTPALKRYVVEHIDMFSGCLVGKLLVYATGRALTFRDRREVERIVAAAKSRGNGFRDLILEAVGSEAFATR